MKPEIEPKKHSESLAMFDHLLSEFDNRTAVEILLDLISLFREHVNENNKTYSDLHEKLFKSLKL